MNFKIEIKKRILDLGFSEVKFLNEKNTPKTIVIAAFPYEVNKTYQGNGIRISPFAQKDHYGEAVNRLKKVSLYIREEKSLTKKDIRIFCNSQLTEKLYAASSGLGFYGRNSLIITKKTGSRVILAGLVLPFELEGDSPARGACTPGEKCGNCHACITNCPTSAIGEKGIIDRNICLQSLTTDERILPVEIMEKWGNRLYGCSICQDCCPYNRNISGEYGVIKGYLGETVPFEKILQSTDEELKEFLRGSALSMSWISFDLLRRNAIISTVAADRKDLILSIENYLDHEKLSYAAKWAIEKLSKKI
jgi:epoxyqueuosine reductase